MEWVLSFLDSLLLELSMRGEKRKSISLVSVLLWESLDFLPSSEALGTWLHYTTAASRCEAAESLHT